MNLRYIVFLAALISGAATVAMEAPQAPQQIALHTLPREVQTIVISQAGDTLIKTCANIRSLACVNKSLNQFLKVENNTIAIINSLAHRFGKTRLEVALHLRTPDSHAWMKRCFAEDTNNEFARMLSQKLHSTAAQTHSLQSAISRQILQRVLNETNYPEHIIEDFKRCHFSEDSNEHYKIAAYLCKKFPSIINEKNISYDDDPLTALMIAIQTCSPDIVVLLLKAGADLRGNDAWDRAVNTHQFHTQWRGWNVPEPELAAMNAISHETQYYNACANLEIIKKAYQTRLTKRCAIQ